MVINKEVSQQWLFLLFFAKKASPIMKGVTKMRAFIIDFIKGLAYTALGILNTIIVVLVWSSIKD